MFDRKTRNYHTGQAQKSRESFLDKGFVPPYFKQRRSACRVAGKYSMHTCDCCSVAVHAMCTDSPVVLESSPIFVSREWRLTPASSELIFKSQHSNTPYTDLVTIKGFSLNTSWQAVLSVDTSSAHGGQVGRSLRPA